MNNLHLKLSYGATVSKGLRVKLFLQTRLSYEVMVSDVLMVKVTLGDQNGLR